MSSHPDLLEFVDKYLYDLKRSVLPLSKESETELLHHFQSKLYRRVYEDEVREDIGSSSGRTICRIGWLSKIVEFNPQLTQVSTRCPNVLSFPYQAVLEGSGEMYSYSREKTGLPNIPDAEAREWVNEFDERYFQVLGITTIVYRLAALRENQGQIIDPLFNDYRIGDITITHVDADPEYEPLS